MKKLLFLLTVCLSCCGIWAQNVVNDPNAEVRQVQTFHSLKVSNGIQLFLSQAGEQKVVVSASEVPYRNRIRTEVRDGVLRIYYDAETAKWFDMSKKQLKAYVSCTALDGVDANSGAKVEVDGTLKSPNLALILSSGARFRGMLETGSLSIDGSSGAHADLSGSARELKAEASSGSRLSGYDLEAQKCDVSASSGAHIDISVGKEMAASAHSGGHISYAGGGVIREVHTGSGGSVSKR